MRDEIKRGRTMSLVLLCAVSIIFVVNVFYPLYLSPPNRSNRFTVLCLMLALVALAYRGVSGMRIVISGVLFLLALIDTLVLFAALSDHNFRVSLGVSCIVAGFMTIGWLLLSSKSVRAFEIARQSRRLA